MIPWKRFTTKKDGVRLEVTWWAHDYTVRYRIGFITLKYGRHIMAMCPMQYSENELRDSFEKDGLYASFKEAGDILINQTVLLDIIKAKFSEAKNEQSQQNEIINKKLRELRQQFKAGNLTQKEYQFQIKPLKKRKSDLDWEYSKQARQTIETLTAESITPINMATSDIIRDYLKELWESAE